MANKKPKGHYCKICGERKANEKFSGKGHSNHICKDCSKLSPAEQAESMTINRLLNLDFIHLSQADKKWLENRTRDKRPEVQKIAEDIYNMKFPYAKRNAQKKALRLNNFKFFIDTTIYDEYGDENEVNCIFSFERDKRILNYEDKYSGKIKTAELTKQETDKLLKWMIHTLEVFCWDEYCNENIDDIYDDEEVEDFLDFIGVPTCEQENPCWELNLEYADETEQNIKSFDFAYPDGLDVLYFELLEYFYEDDVDFSEDLINCNDLKEIADYIESVVVSDNQTELACLLFDLIETDLDFENNQEKHYTIYENGCANFKFLQSYIVQGHVNEELSVYDKFIDFISFARNEVTEPKFSRLQKDEVIKVLETIDAKYSFTSKINNLKILLLNNSHTEYNSICNIVSDIHGNQHISSEIYLFNIKNENVKNPLYVFLHELGHTVQVMISDDAQKAPDIFLKVSDKMLNVPLEQGPQAVELFADVFAMGLMRIFGWEDKDVTKEIDDFTIEIFAKLTHLILTDLIK